MWQERKEDRTVLIFILNEGRNRQIRRMCEAVDLSVVRLKRTEIAGVKLGMLPQGKWRELNEREMAGGSPMYRKAGRKKIDYLSPLDR